MSPNMRRQIVNENESLIANVNHEIAKLEEARKGFEAGSWDDINARTEIENLCGQKREALDAIDRVFDEMEQEAEWLQPE